MTLAKAKLMLFFKMVLIHIFLRDKEKTIEIIAPNYPNFIIWKPNQACNFVCVEPWASIPDHEKGAKVDLSQKMGVLSLGRHKKNKFFMKIKVIK